MSKEGYVAQTGLITTDPYRWVNLNYTAEKIYYVIAKTTFSVKLEKIADFIGTNPLAPSGATMTPANISATPALTVEQLVQNSLPAVVTVQPGRRPAVASSSRKAESSSPTAMWWRVKRASP